MRAHTGCKPFICHVCQKAFRQSDDLNTYMRIHTGDKPYKCLLCDKSFRKSCTLQSHKRCKHNNICEKKFTKKSTLKDHIQRHEGVKPYVCDDCPKCFCTAFELRKHQLVHSDFKGFCCGLCGKDFKRPAAVKRHFRWCSDGVDCDSILWNNHHTLVVCYHLLYFWTFLLAFYAIVLARLTCCTICHVHVYEIWYDIGSGILITITETKTITLCRFFRH